ncbi:MAG: DUF6494 family protein [Pseudomonadales bacterium]
MNEDTLNMEIRKFLKKVGITSQREIERAIQDGLKSGALKGGESLAVKVVLSIPDLAVDHQIDGSISLE